MVSTAPKLRSITLHYITHCNKFVCLGQFPGPLIECNTGDRLVVKVNNQLPDGQGTSIHWHGIFQADSNWMDGTVGVTQCPIPPGQSYTYNFTVPNQHGTYWWHSHQKGQYTDGILGPLIIHDPNERNNTQYDEDLIVMLSGTQFSPPTLTTPFYLLF
jgi:FtsP/CotA-like multicopper oxidase with cupredoxin domain